MTFIYHPWWLMASVLRCTMPSAISVAAIRMDWARLAMCCLKSAAHEFWGAIQ